LCVQRQGCFLKYFLGLTSAINIRVSSGHEVVLHGLVGFPIMLLIEALHFLLASCTFRPWCLPMTVYRAW